MKEEQELKKPEKECYLTDKDKRLKCYLCNIKENCSLADYNDGLDDMEAYYKQEMLKGSIKWHKAGWEDAMRERPSLSVEEIFKLLSNTRSCFCNPNHYSLKEQANIIMKDALAIKSKIGE